MTRNAGVLVAAVLALLTLVSCSKQPAEIRQATVFLQDGSQISGGVMASSASEITLAGGDNITRKIPMSQVKSVQYVEVAPQTPAPAANQPPAPAASGPAKSTRAESAREASKPVVPTEQAQASTPTPAAPARLVRTFALPAGTELPIRVNEEIDSAKATGGQNYAAEVSKDVLNSTGTVVIPKGTAAQLVIVSASEGGKIRGASDLVLSLASVTVGGRSYELNTSNVAQRGQDGVGANKRTATYTGGAAAVGAIIGAIAGGGKGAAIGAGAGAGAGALTQILTRGKSIRVPAESLLTFNLEAPLNIVAD